MDSARQFSQVSAAKFATLAPAYTYVLHPVTPASGICSTFANASAVSTACCHRTKIFRRSTSSCESRRQVWCQVWCQQMYQYQLIHRKPCTLFSLWGFSSALPTPRSPLPEQ